MRLSNHFGANTTICHSSLYYFDQASRPTRLVSRDDADYVETDINSRAGAESKYHQLAAYLLPIRILYIGRHFAVSASFNILVRAADISRAQIGRYLPPVGSAADRYATASTARYPRLNLCHSFTKSSQFVPY